MAQYRKIPAGSTSRIIQVEVLDSSSTTGAKLAGLAYNTASLTAYYNRAGAAGAATAISLVTATKGTWVSSGFVAVDGTNMPGIYELHVPDAAFAAGAKEVSIVLKGAANMVPVHIVAELDASLATDGSNATANLTKIDGLTTTDGAAILKLKQLNVVNSTGDAIIASSTGGDGKGINASGNGAGQGILATGGATNASGISAVGAGTGDGILGTCGASGGSGIKGIGRTAGINGVSNATNGPGIAGTGAGNGAGVLGTGGATGNGINALGGATSGDAISATTTNGHGIYGSSSGVGKSGLYMKGSGAGAGITGMGGTTGPGITGIGGSTSGNGIHAYSPLLGDGMALVGAGAGKVDLRANRTGDLTGNVSGSVGSVTASVNTNDTAPDNAGIAAIKAKTDNLPASPAAVGSAMVLTSAYDPAKTAAQDSTVMKAVNYVTPPNVSDIATAVEGHFLNEEDGQAVVEAIVTAVNAAPLNLGGLSVVAITAAVISAIEELGYSTEGNATLNKEAIISAIPSIVGLATEENATSNKESVISALPSVNGLATEANATSNKQAVISAIPSVTALATEANATSNREAVISAIPEGLDLTEIVEVINGMSEPDNAGISLIRKLLTNKTVEVTEDGVTVVTLFDDDGEAVLGSWTWAESDKTRGKLA